MREWLHDNIPWAFSGAGIALLATVFRLFFRRRASHQGSTSGRARADISAGRDVHVYSLTGLGPSPPPDQSPVQTVRSPEPTHETAASTMSVRLSDLAKASIDKLPVTTSDILDLLGSELRSHPLLVMLDYESMPIPLAKGIYVVLTKLGADLVVEMVSASPVNPSISAVWDDACKAYLEAYRLPFRSSQLALLRETEYKRSRHVVQRLLEQIQQYVYVMRLTDIGAGYESLHRLKGEAAAAMLNSEITYYEYLESDNREFLLGKAAIELDTAISCAHKILLQHGLSP